jgi:muramoyltetrapeptide carboxypeptidase
MKQGDTIALVCCSNGQRRGYENRIQDLIKQFEDMGLSVLSSRYLYEDQRELTGNGEKRGKELMDFYENPQITDIFDVSGGDLANELLPYLDYDLIQQTPIIFWGYSDLTTLINAIYKKTGKLSILYQVRNLLYQQQIEQIADFMEYMMLLEKKPNLIKKASLFTIKTLFLQGKSMKGIVLGGNIRCLLKLAGTPYMPEFQNAILLLESYSGKIPQLITYFAQLKQMGVFDDISGIILGTFTEIMQEESYELMYEVLKPFIPDNLPVAYTPNIGHGTDAKAIWIGADMTLIGEEFS